MCIRDSFGSVDGDSPAAMRYTEARLNKLGEAMMDDLYKDCLLYTSNPMFTHIMIFLFHV